MEMEELKAAWHDMERKLAATNLAVEEIRVERGLDRSRAALRPLSVTLGLELIQEAAAALMLGAFLASHWREPKFAVLAVGLLALILLAASSEIRQMAMLRQIEYAAPVAEVQRRLADLRFLRLRTRRWVLLLAPLVWAPLLVVAARGLVGLDIYAGLGWPWVVANVAFGAAFAVVLAWASRRWGNRLAGTRWAVALADDLAGRSLARAIAQAREAASFVEDASAQERR
jgi:hypothetical protein